MAVDFGKLNKAGLGASSFGTRKTTGTSAQVARNLSSSSPATRSSVFSFRGASKTNWTPGQHVTKGMSKYNYQGMRAAMNSGGPRTYAPSYSGPVGNYNNVGSVKVNNDYAKGMIIGQTIMGGINLLNQLGVFDGLKGDGSSSLGDKLDNALGNVGGAGGTSYASKLSGADSFNELNSLEKNVNTKKENLNSDYKSLDASSAMSEIASGVSDGFELAGVSLDTNSLTLSTLDKSNLEGCIDTIESDIDKYGNFQTNDLPAARNQITTKSGQIKGEISAKEGQLSQLEANNSEGQNTAQINQLKQEIEKLKEQQEQLKKAEQAIDQLNTKCEEAKGDLEAKKAEIKDIKKFEDNVKDKKYNLAKSQDKDLKQALEKLKKLDAEIAKASVDKNGDEYNKKDDRRNNKLQKLTSERAAIFGSMSKLISSLNAAGSAPIENSKGQSYTISNLSAAMSYKPEEVQS